MPMICFSTCVLALLSLDDLETSHSLWEMPDVLSKFGISSRPSTDMTTTPPLGLKPETARDIRIFADSIRNRPPATWISFIDEGEDCGAGREGWRAWFKSTIGPAIKDVMDAALKEAEVYPGQLVDEDSPDVFPSSNAAATESLADIAGAFLGETIFSRNGRQLRDEVRDWFGTIVRLSYERIKRAWKRKGKHLKPARLAADEAMREIETSEKVTLTMIRQATSKVKQYKDAATLSEGEWEKIESYIASLQELLVHAGKTISESRGGPDLDKKGEERVKAARSRMSKKSIVQADLANEEEVQATWHLFVSSFVTEPDRPIPAQQDQLQSELWNMDSGNYGVDEAELRGLDEAALSQLLGFKDGRPPTWAPYRSNDPAINAWDSPDLPLFDGFKKIDPKVPEGAQPIKLLYHQLVGIAAMILKSFSKDEPTTDLPYNPGVILADAVGVGKTGQMMGYMTCLQAIWASEQEGSDVPRPAIVADRHYFMGKKGVPNLPNLIVAPNTVCEQWRLELKSFTRPNTIDIFEFPTANDVDFWNSEAWSVKSKHEKIFRVIICPQSAFQTMSLRTFETGPAGRKRKTIDCKRRITNPKAWERSVFSKQWATTFYDEAHEFRSASAKWVGAIQLRKNVRFVCCATATPIYQNVKDVLYIGRMVGITDFMGDNGRKLELEGSRVINQTRQQMSAGEREQIERIVEARIRGQDTSKMHDPRQEMIDSGLKYVKKLQDAIGNRMIRRTVDSLKPDGTRINESLPPCVRLNYPVVLPDDELHQLRGEIDKMKTGGKADRLSYFEWSSEAFYSFYRTLVAYPFPKPVKSKKEDPRLRWPVFESYEAWVAQKGAKLGELIELNQRVLADDNAGPFTVNPDGSIEWPPVSENPQQTRKVLIYHEWPMMAATITSAFNVHGLFPYVINGTQSVEERNQVLRDFISNQDPKRRILLFSKVGAVGLNLACADVVILYDIVWSDVEAIQIIGRAHRFGQKRTVYVYNMLALGTTDVMMSSNAKFKDDMLSVLVTKQTKKSKEQEKSEEDLRKMVSGEMSKETEDDEDLDDLQVGEKGDSETAVKPVKKRARKSAKKAASQEEGKEKKEKKSGKGRKKKTATEVEQPEEMNVDNPPSKDGPSREPSEPSSSSVSPTPPPPPQTEPSETPTPPVVSPENATPPSSSTPPTPSLPTVSTPPAPPLPPSLTSPAPSLPANTPLAPLLNTSAQVQPSSSTSPAVVVQTPSDQSEQPVDSSITSDKSEKPVQEPSKLSDIMTLPLENQPPITPEDKSDTPPNTPLSPVPEEDAAMDVDQPEMQDDAPSATPDELKFDDDIPPSSISTLRRSSRTPGTPSRTTSQSNDTESPQLTKSRKRRSRAVTSAFQEEEEDDTGAPLASILCAKRPVGIGSLQPVSNKRRSVSREESEAPSGGSSRASSTAPEVKKYSSLKNRMKPRK